MNFAPSLELGAPHKAARWRLRAEPWLHFLLGLALAAGAILVLNAWRGSLLQGTDGVVVLSLAIALAILQGGWLGGLGACLLALPFQAKTLAAPNQPLWPPSPAWFWLAPDEWSRWMLLAGAAVILTGAVEKFRARAREAPQRSEDEARRALMQALQKHERGAAELSGVLSQIAEAVIITDPLGRVTFVNAQAARLHGMEVAAGGPFNFRDLPIGEQLKKCHSFALDGTPLSPGELPLARAVEHDETVRDAEWRVQRPDGTEFIAQGSAMPVRAPDGRTLGAVLTMRDVTPQRKMLAELEESNKLKDEFLSVMSHELRTPLTPILGWVSLLRKDGKAPDPALLDQAFEAIERNALQQKKLVDDLLDATNLMSGGWKLKPQVQPITPLLRQVMGMYQGRAETRGLALTADLDGVLPSLSLDGARFQQALAYIVDNALKFSPPNGHVTLRARAEDEQILIEVEDQGEGIAPEALGHIFTMFRQSDSSLTRRHGGLGLGLTLARTLVEAHGGTLTAHSDGVGRGARFTITLPVGDGAAGL